MYIVYRFGVGKKGMENTCLEELQYLNEEIRKNNKAFNMSVSKSVLLLLTKATFNSFLNYCSKTVFLN